MTGFFVKTAPALALVAGLAISPTDTLAQGQTICGARDSIIAQLEAKYGETRKSVGFQQGRGVVEVYASEETGSWTILVTDARGHSCLMAAGEAFQAESVAKADTPT